MTKKESTHRFCVSIGEKTQNDVLSVAKEISDEADVIEIRLDCLEELSIDPYIQEISKPLLFTNRPTWEGGAFSGEEDERIAPLLEAIDKNAAFVDFEYLAPKESFAHVKDVIEKSDTQLILSWHNFTLTPTREELLEVMMIMLDKGADIGKIVTMAHDSEDVLRVLRLLEDAHLLGFPLIAFCMGEVGTISRVATLEHGGYMTYCSVSDGKGTAPGQVSLETLKEIYSRSGL
jgi:3-dehydroquinate dehydratase I